MQITQQHHKAGHNTPTGNSNYGKVTVAQDKGSITEMVQKH